LKGVQVDKVVAVRQLLAIPNKEARRAELLLMQGKHAAAEETLVGQHLYWAVIELNLKLFRWERALGFAEQAQDERHLKAVLGHRCAFLPVPCVVLACNI
jgi:hypothetical protein